MRPVSAIYAVQAGLQAADRGDAGIWRTPCSEKGPPDGTFELAHVLEIIGSICRVQAGLQAADGDDTGIWRTPCSEKGPSGGTFELAHVLEIIGNSCRASWLAGGRW